MGGRVRRRSGSGAGAFQIGRILMPALNITVLIIFW